MSSAKELFNKHKSRLPGTNAGFILEDGGEMTVIEPSEMRAMNPQKLRARMKKKGVAGSFFKGSKGPVFNVMAGKQGGHADQPWVKKQLRQELGVSTLEVVTDSGADLEEEAPTGSAPESPTGSALPSIKGVSVADLGALELLDDTTSTMNTRDWELREHRELGGLLDLLDGPDVEPPPVVPPDVADGPFASVTGTDKRKTKLTGKNIGGSRDISTTVEVRDADGSEATTESLGVSAQVGGGVQVGARSGKTTTVKSGGITATHGTSGEDRAGIVMKEDEVGISGGRTTEETTTRTSSKDAVDVSLTNKGGAVKTTKERRVKGKHATLTGKRTLSGGVTLDVDLVKGSDPPEYKLVLKVQLGGELGVSAGTTGKTAGLSGGVKGGASGALTYAHVMGAAEAEQYIGAVERTTEGGSGQGDLPEFGMIERLRAALAQAGPAAATPFAMASSAWAKDLAEGDTLTLDLEAHGSVEGKGSVSGGGVGVSVEGKRSGKATRKVQLAAITVDGEKRIAVTMVFGSAEATALGLKVTGEGATVGKKGTDEAAEGTSRTFHLDPEAEDYGEVFDRITGAWTAEELDGLAARSPLKEHLVSTTKERSSKNTDQTTVSAAGVGVAVTGTGEQSEKITTDAEGYDVAVAGSGGAKGAGVVGGTELLSRENSGGMTGHLNSDTGIRTVFEETDAGRDLTGGDLGAIADVLTTGPGKALQAALTTQWTHLSGYALNEEHTRKLFARAGNASHWATAGQFSYPHNEAWMALRIQLVRPKPAPEFAEVDADAARDLTRLRALSSFMKASGTTGKNCITNVLRHWGKGIGATERSDAEDLGGFYELPPALSVHKPLLDNLRAQVPRMLVSLQQSVSEVHGELPAALEGKLTGLLDGITTLRTAIFKCDDFDAQRAKMEMLDDLQKWQNDLEVAAEEARVAMSGDPYLLNEELLRDVERLEALLPDFKRQEAKALESIKAYMSDEQETWGSSLMAGLSGAFSNGVFEEVDQMTDLYEEWVARIRELRRAYAAAGVPENQWLVSVASGQPRDLDHEPEPAEYVRLWAKLEAKGLHLDTLDRRRVKKMEKYTLY